MTNAAGDRAAQQNLARQRVVVSAAEMQAIEARLFEAGMPVAALMEKVSGRIAAWIVAQYPLAKRVLVLAGPGHNGGDALSVARELYHQGYCVSVCSPIAQQKALTAQHDRYLKALGVPSVAAGQVAHQSPDQIPDLILDGLFGFGLSRPIAGDLAQLVRDVNALGAPVVSIDLPSGIHTDSGEALGEAIRATQTLCLGLWKRACLQDQALAYMGQATLIDFDIPTRDIEAVLGELRLIRITPPDVAEALPLRRSPTTYKYREGHLLLVCGSASYLGAALLTGLAARASGVGMLAIAVPQALKPLLAAQIPDAVTLGCPTEAGAIAAFPEDVDLGRYDAIACGPGLTPRAGILPQILSARVPLLLDADGLNLVAQIGTQTALEQREAYTLLTPHAGEFERLFPCGKEPLTTKPDRITQAQQAAHQSGATVLLKGARAIIASPDGKTWINPDSTPALARGGSGDVLTGLIGGLMAQAAARQEPVESAAWSGAWWHAQTAIELAQARGVLGVDAHTLAAHLATCLARRLW
ncbi:MAG: NAD(P)H-hydrate dehydratase [Elainellaceae cyanobacterium]